MKIPKSDYVTTVLCSQLKHKMVLVNTLIPNFYIFKCESCKIAYSINKGFFW